LEAGNHMVPDSGTNHAGSQIAAYNHSCHNAYFCVFEVIRIATLLSFMVYVDLI
jgi:hypothetical protein